MDPHHGDAATYDPDADLDSDFYLMRKRTRIRLFQPDADPDSDLSFQIKAQTLEKVLK